MPFFVYICEFIFRQIMKKFILIFCFIIGCTVLNAQDTTVFEAYSDEIENRLRACYETADDTEKIKLASAAFEKLEEALQQEGAFEYDFYKLKNISSVVSQDGKLRILTFGTALNSGKYIYYGFIMYYNGETLRITKLTDDAGKQSNPQNADMQADNWFGAIYYEIRQFGDPRSPVYALCGWDGADMFINRKVLEQLVIGEYGEPRFGGKFRSEKEGESTRLIFSYTERATMSLGYNQKLKMIVGDHLSTPPQYRGNVRFLGPDMSFDGFAYENGKWVYYPDVDVKLKKDNLNNRQRQNPVNTVRNPWDL